MGRKRRFGVCRPDVGSWREAEAVSLGNATRSGSMVGGAVVR